MTEDRPDPPPLQAEPSWEQSVEAELYWLRREVERLSALATKLGSHVKLLMTERDERQRHAKASRR
jgi:hypothetical protein